MISERRKTISFSDSKENSLLKEWREREREEKKRIITDLIKYEKNCTLKKIYPKIKFHQ